MTFGLLWPIIFLILVPVILILYMLKQKATTQNFSSVMLWREVYKNIEATKPWEKLKHNILMYLQILTVIGLVFALMSPYLKSGGDGFKNVLLVIDNSASMNYSYNEKTTRFEEEIDRACKYVDSLDDSSNITVVTVGKSAKLEFSGINDKTEIKKKLRNLDTTELAGDLNNSISMVSSIVKQWDNYQVVMFTDTAVSLGEIEATVINLYSEGNNASVDYVSYGYEEGKLVVLAKITNYSKNTLNTDINLYGDEGILGVEAISVSPNSSQVVYFNDIIYTGTYLKAEINEKDALINDNLAYKIMSDSKLKKVLLITESNVFLEKAIGVNTNIEVYKATETSVINDEDKFDIYVFDGVVPAVLPQGNLFFVIPGNTTDIEIAKEIDGVMLTILPTDITNYISDYSFGVNQGKAMKLPNWATSYINVEDGSVGYYGEHNGRTIVTLGFDIHNTDVALQPEFPILISNIMNYMTKSSLIANTDIATGDIETFNTSINGEGIRITNPAGDTTRIPIENEQIFDETNYAGIYKVQQKVNQEDTVNYFAVNFPVNEESNVAEVTSNQGKTIGKDAKLSGGRELRNILICILLCLLVIEWIVYLKQR